MVVGAWALTEGVVNALLRQTIASGPGIANQGIAILTRPADREEIIAVMRAAGDRSDGPRLRDVIVVLWRAKRSPFREAISTGHRGAVPVLATGFAAGL